MASGVAVGDLVDGKYRLVRLIGEGGWGIVFEAENVRTVKRVALKILRTHAGVTPDIQARFQREAQAAGRIGSDHIVEVFDLGVVDDGTHYMVMELLAGQDLASRLREAGRLEPVVTARIVLQLLDGLNAAHDAGILHRDVKPENLFLVPTRSGEEFVKILDFGISKFNGDAAGMPSATMTGAVLGSPCYMAPEQARGLKHVDKRTDLYAVGTLMFECLTGRVPFEGDNFNDLMFKIVLAPRPNPCELDPSLDPDLGRLVTKAMATDPSERFQTAAELRAAIMAWLASRGVTSVHPPELKRVVARTTPRITGDQRASLPEGMTPQVGSARVIVTGTPIVSGTPVRSGTPVISVTPAGRELAHWSEATMRAESGMGTPLAASSATPPPAARQTRSGARRAALWSGAGALVLFIAAALVIGRVSIHRSVERATASGASDSAHAVEVAAPDVPHVAQSPGTPTTTVLAPPPSAASLASPPVAEVGAPSSGGHPLLAGHSTGGTGFAARPPVSAKSAGSLPAVAASKTPDVPSVSPPPAAVAAPAVPKGGTIEGREIRTGL